MAVNPITSLPGLNPIRTQELAGNAPAGEAKFAGMLADAIGKVERYRTEAHDGVESFLSGETEDLHQVALQTQRAELAFEMFLQVRNKVVQAYQEVMRMQV